MNKLLTLTLLINILSLVYLPNLFAQPSNDECVNATDISYAFQGNCGEYTLSGPFDLTGATPGTNDPPEPGGVGVCPNADLDDQFLFGDSATFLERSIWLSFTVPDLNGDGSPVAYSIWTSDGTYNDDCGLNPTPILISVDTQVAIYEGACPTSTTDQCDYYAANDDLFDLPPWISGWYNITFTPGETYYMMVDSWDGFGGEFCLTVVACGVQCGDGVCSPVEDYCVCQEDCTDLCPAVQLYGVSETEDGAILSPDWLGNVLHCSQTVLGYSNNNIYLTVYGSNENCIEDGLDLPIELSIGNLIGQDGGIDTIFDTYHYIELTPVEFATGSITISATAPDGLGNMCSNSVTIDLTAIELTCDIICNAGGIQESLLPPNSLTVCEDGTISLCTNGLEDLTLPCDGPDGFDYYWKVYVAPFGPGSNWYGVSGWVQLGPCPTNIPVSDLFIDIDGFLPPYVPGSQIQAIDFSTNQPGPMQVYIEGAALCVDSNGDVIDGCSPLNENGTTYLNGIDKSIIYVNYYPAGDPACDGCTQSINLNSGWNLISLDVSPPVISMQDVFNNPLLGNLEFVTGFNAGTITFDPNIPIPFNVLQNVEDGFGYWVKVENTDVLMVEGTCLADDFRKPLDAGWNLIAYPPDDPQSPATYFADLIADNNLEFVTGFDGGITTFDPNLPAPFNTLQQLENGFGYWVKVTNATD